jgi:uncharacterized protein YcfJ
MKSNLLVGAVAGIGIAVAGGVAGFTMIGETSNDEAVAEITAETAALDAAPAQTQARPVAAAPVAAQPQPAPAPAPRQSPAPVETAQVTPAEECWEETVEVPAEPRDDKAIAGTAAGALIGGALADRLGDDDDLVTAAGAAAGAFIGRKAQREYQENRTTTETVTRCGTR